jgi:hypothetical protein
MRKHYKWPKPTTKRECVFDIIPDEITLRILEYVAPSTLQQFLFYVSKKRFTHLASTSVIVQNTFNEFAQETVQEYSLSEEYFHEAVLCGWLIENYKFYLQAYIARMDASDRKKYKEAFQEYRPTNYTSISFVDDTFEDLLRACNLWQPNRSGIYTNKCLNRASAFYNAPSFECYSRLLSYSIRVPFDLIDLYGLPQHIRTDMLKPRELNSFENTLFSVYHPPKNIQSIRENDSRMNQESDSIIVPTLKAFKKRMNKLFLFRKWKKCIDWKNLFLVGGSVLRAILTNDYAAQDQDLDFFYIGSGYYAYGRVFDALVEQLKTVFKNVESNDRNNYVKTITIKKKERKLVFQVIWYDSLMSKELILSIFDMEASMIGFDGKRVLVTRGWVQSQTTGTSVNYKMINNQKDMDLYLPRCIKYWLRGWDILVPKEFDTKQLDKFFTMDAIDLKSKIAGLRVVHTKAGGQDNVEVNLEDDFEDVEDEHDTTYCGFLLNNDTFTMREKFVALVAPNVHPVSTED